MAWLSTIFSLNGRAIKIYPPIMLNGRWNFGTLETKVPKKIIFSLMARPLREELFFMASQKIVNSQAVKGGGGVGKVCYINTYEDKQTKK